MSGSIDVSNVVNSSNELNDSHSSLISPGISTFNPLLSRIGTNNSGSSQNERSNPLDDRDHLVTVPMIREAYYGQSLGQRSTAQVESWNEGQFPLGGPDLIHWGKYHGVRSSQYLDHDFGLSDSQSHNSNHEDDISRKNDDGYVGYYHYSNGLDVSNDENIELYICKLVGLEKVGMSQYKKLDVDTLRQKNLQQLSPLRSNTSALSAGNNGNIGGGSSSHAANSPLSSSSNNYSLRKEMMITFCTYNIFSKSDFRIRYVINLSNPIRIDISYQVLNSNKKTYSFNTDTIKQLSEQFWDELRASQLIKLFADLEDPSRQISGLVSHPDLISSYNQLLISATTLVKLLPKGYIADYKTRDGFSSGWGDKRNGYKKTNHYKNGLVDALIKCCRFSGELCFDVINLIEEKYPQFEWDYVILQILKVQDGMGPNDQKFINVIYNFLKDKPDSTQKTLILLEQVRFLISKEKYELAIKVSEKCIKLLPLDFDCWYYLILSYLMNGQFDKALITMNSLPIITSQKQRNNDIDKISGIPDSFINTFINRINDNYDEIISEGTFLNYFPKPVIQLNKYQRLQVKTKSSKVKFIEQGSIDLLWNEIFLFDSTLRHSITGNQFYQSPLMNSGPKELSSVDPNLIRTFGPTSGKSILASQSSGTPTSSISNFTNKSTWGRSYDLLTLFIGIVGWDLLIETKERVFKKRDIGNNSSLNSSKKILVVDDSLEADKFYCERWLEQLFLIIFEDLKTFMTITAPQKDQQHSALEWEMLGFLGWSTKIKIKESICAFITSVKGKEMVGGFDYFGTEKLLSIYNQFVLSDVKDSHIDKYHNTYNGEFFSHKILIKKYGEENYQSFVNDIENNLLNLDFTLLNLMKLISWNLRWYQYLPNDLVITILSKLITKYDSIYIRSKIRIIFEQNKKASTRPKSSKFSFGFGLFKEAKKEEPTSASLFIEGDTIVDYIELLITWIESLSKP